MLGSSGRLTGLPLPPQERGMEPQVNLRVTCRGETQSFLVSDSAHTTWADVEAMVSAACPVPPRYGRPSGGPAAGQRCRSRGCRSRGCRSRGCRSRGEPCQ